MKLSHIALLIGVVALISLVFLNYQIADTLRPLLEDKDLLQKGIQSAGGVRTIPLVLSIFGLITGIFSSHRGDKLGVIGLLLNLICFGTSFVPLYAFFLS